MIDQHLLDIIKATREYREKLLDDPYRPTYHFAQPDSNGQPGDSNGAFYVDGVYHLMYLYWSSLRRAYHWGHISSVDLLHWRNHPDALGGFKGDKGCFSGGAFVDDDKTVYLSFWKFASVKENGDKGGLALAYSKPPYDVWERMEPIAFEGGKIWGTADIEVDGKIRHIACADPSNIWKANGYYYMQAGNKIILDTYGRADDSPDEYRGDFTDLFRSKDLKNWEYVHRFYENPHTNPEWPDVTEDDMCPSLLPLYDAPENGKPTGKYLQLFISHNKGCQYYVGRLENEKFIPEHHGRMSNADNAFFAPEALVDNKGRHIIWTWLLDNINDDFEKYGWSSVYNFPRTVWWANNTLCMAPAKELDSLHMNPQSPDVNDDNSIKINNGNIFRIKAEIDVTGQDKAGFSIKASDEQKCHTDIYYDKKAKLLVFDASESGAFGWKIKENAPLELAEGENLILDIFADKSIVEVYANNRQAICRRVYPEDPTTATGIKLISGKGCVISLEAFDMAPTNPY